MNDGRPHAPAAERNRDPILAVLRHELETSRSVLEIGSGTGQHAVYFTAALPWLTWHPTDRAENLPGIRAWAADCPSDNLREPLELDVSAPPAISETYDAAFSANTAHIMSLDEVRLMFGLLDDALSATARFCLYGPFNIGGEFTAGSNQQFDASLRSQDPRMGIRDIEELDQFAGEGGFRRSALHAMPANNFIAVWSRSG